MGTFEFLVALITLGGVSTIVIYMVWKVSTWGLTHRYPPPGVLERIEKINTRGCESTPTPHLNLDYTFKDMGEIRQYLELIETTQDRENRKYQKQVVLKGIEEKVKEMIQKKEL